MAHLSFSEAYFALSRIISYADGTMQEAEVDALTTLRMVEQLDIAVYDKIDDKLDDEAVFQLSIDSLQEASDEDRARACAWMLMTAMVAQEGGVTTEALKWDTTLANVSTEERDWITKAQKALHVVESSLEEAFALIPRVRKLD